MTKKSVNSIISDLLKLENGVYHISIKNEKFHYTKEYLKDSIEIAVINKKNNDVNNLFTQFYDNFNRVVTCENQNDNNYSDNYYTVAKLNNNQLNIKYNAIKFEWCSIQKLKVQNGSY